MSDPVKIKSAKNPDNQVRFEIELADGSTLEFSVPKLQYVPIDIMDVYEPWLEQWERDVTAAIPAPTARSGKAKAQAPKKRTYDAAFKLFELILDEETYKKLDALTHGEKVDIERAWAAQSETSMGESGASVGS